MGFDGVLVPETQKFMFDADHLEIRLQEGQFVVKFSGVDFFEIFNFPYRVVGLILRFRVAVLMHIGRIRM